MKQLPYLDGKGKNTRLIVDGKSFHARSGELHNSSASSSDYMDEQVWPALRGMHMNSVIAPVYWECTEPEPGQFDYSLLDKMIVRAQEEGLRLILLWFGLWKNSGSTYAPEWMKKDRAQYFRVQNAGGRPMGRRRLVGGTHTISPFCEAAVDADANAFGHMMAHLAAFDKEQTVIMIQVENEIGVLNCDRDYGEAAERAFRAGIPEAVEVEFGATGTWQEAFGEDAAEHFMAWHYAVATQKIVKAGKSTCNLPMYVNAWLEQSPWKPGSYPSGGPQFKMRRMWRLAAPDIDLFAPDIYVDNFRDVADEYASDGNPLFIPEARQTWDTVAWCLYAIGQHNALCYAPFGIEDMNGNQSAMDSELLKTLNIPAEAMKTSAGVGAALSRAYYFLENMEGTLEEAHREDRVHGFLDNGDVSEYVSLRNLELEINYKEQPGSAVGGGLVIDLGDHEFVVLAVNCSISVNPLDGAEDQLELLTKEEGAYQDSHWVRRRILNGDEQLNHRFGQMPTMLRFKYCPFRI